MRIVRAYNQDLLDNPQVVLEDVGRKLLQIEGNYLIILPGENQALSRWFDIPIYDSMERTMAVIEEMGAGEWLEDISDVGVNGVVLHRQKRYPDSGQSVSDEWIRITDPDEIREILKLTSPVSIYAGFSGGIFMEESYVRVEVIRDIQDHEFGMETQESATLGYFREDMLPEKYSDGWLTDGLQQ